MSSRKFLCRKVPCDKCIHLRLPFNVEPCKTCINTETFTKFKDKGFSDMAVAVSNITSNITRNKEERENNICGAIEEYYDKHYVSAHQPIETMQANMSHDEFIGFLKGNIIKYVCRLGKKDNIEKETAKIKRYAEWLEQAVKGQTIDPRK